MSGAASGIEDNKSTYLFLAGDDGLADARGEDEDLVDEVHLVANVAADGDLHRHELAVQSRVHDLSELAKRSHFRGHAGEVDHLVLWRRGRHLFVFGEEVAAG